jgi:hypothetical protein
MVPRIFGARNPIETRSGARTIYWTRFLDHWCLVTRQSRSRDKRGIESIWSALAIRVRFEFEEWYHCAEEY